MYRNRWLCKMTTFNNQPHITALHLLNDYITLIS